jgi:hypothetical protein
LTKEIKGSKMPRWTPEARVPKSASIFPSAMAGERGYNYFAAPANAMSSNGIQLD